MEPVITDCPKCGLVTEHRLLKPGDNSSTVKCEDCGDVRSITPPRVRIIDLKLIISELDKARNDRMEVPREEEVAVGLEFDLNEQRLIVTGIEVEGKTVQKAKAEDIKILHAKVFNTVQLKFSVNEDDKTHSYHLDVDPDRAVSIGEVFKVDSRLICIKTIKSDQNRTLHRGWLAARHIVRCFADPAPWKAREGRIMKARRRGAPITRRDKPTSRIKAPPGRRPPAQLTPIVMTEARSARIETMTDLLCHIEIMKEGHFFIARTETDAGAKEFKNTIFEDMLTEMILTLQEQLVDHA